MSDIDSVQQWLQDLRWMTESECMTVLQGKSLTQDGGSQSASPPPKSPKGTQSQLNQGKLKKHTLTQL
jgi:hypothetical protein